MIRLYHKRAVASSNVYVLTAYDYAKQLDPVPPAAKTSNDGQTLDTIYKTSQYSAILALFGVEYKDDKTDNTTFTGWNALKDGGYFVLTDYFASDDAEEALHRRTLLALKAEQGITDDAFYHYDTPLTVEHEIEALRLAGFSSVEARNHWGATYTLLATK